MPFPEKTAGLLNGSGNYAERLSALQKKICLIEWKKNDRSKHEENSEVL